MHDVMTAPPAPAPPGAQGAPVFEDFLEQAFWPDKAGLRHTTLDGYRRDVRRLMPYFEGVPIDRIDHAAIQRMISECPSHKTATNARETLSAILGHAAKARGLLWSNPACGHYIYPDRIEPDEPYQGVWLTDFDEITWWLQRIREEFDGDEVERAAIMALCFGLRKSEAFGVDGRHIKVDEGRLAVRQAYTRGAHACELHGTKNRRSSRDLPMTDYALRRIEEIGVGEGPWVKDSRGRRSNPARVSKRLREWRKKEGLARLTFATMRHSFATASLRSGMDVGSLAVWLGHCDAQTTLRCYARPTVENLSEEARLLDTMIGACPAPRPARPAALTAEQIRAVDALVSDGPLREFVSTLQAMAGLAAASAAGAAASAAAVLGFSAEKERAPKQPEPRERASRDDVRRAVTSLMALDPSITRAEMAERTGSSMSTVKRAIAELRDEQSVRYVGSSKGGHWEVLDPAIL